MMIAITGASGNLGRLVIENMLAKGFPAQQIVAIVRTPSKVADFAQRGVIVRQADYTDPAALRSALQGVDRLLLISSSMVGTRLAHHTNVIEAAKAAGVKFIAYTSILNADKSSNPFAEEHAATEKVLNASGIPAAMLRNAWYSEIYTGQVPTYLASGEVVSATGEGRISGALRTDLAAATANLLLSDVPEARIYELGGTAFTLSELAQQISTLMGQQVTHRKLPEGDLVAHLQSAGTSPSWAQFVADVDTSFARGEMYTDSDDLAKLLGRAPTGLEDALRQSR